MNPEISPTWIDVSPEEIDRRYMSFFRNQKILYILIRIRKESISYIDHRITL